MFSILGMSRLLPKLGLAWLLAIPAAAGSSVDSGVDWQPLLRQSARFVGIQHAFRLATEPGTRAGMRGNFLAGYSHAAGNLHGWSDGDPFYVNYVGHPIQGAVASHLFIQNDRRFRRTEFGSGPDYWKSRLRATAFSFAYSTQFEIGPLSEASIGNIQSAWPQHGFVDHIITPAGGLVWVLVEDALDRFIIKPVENRTTNTAVRILFRGALNPARSFAGVLGGRVPWYRPSRSGIWSYGIVPEPPRPPRGQAPAGGIERLSVTAPAQFRTLGGRNCIGGGGQFALRLSDHFDLVADVNGCRLDLPGMNATGDSLVYQTGPRWRPRISGRWNPHLHFLVGGHKIVARRDREGRDPLTWEANGVAVSMGGGVEVALTRALAVKLANVEYMRSWMPPVNRMELNNGLRAGAGITLRFGTW